MKGKITRILLGGALLLFSVIVSAHGEGGCVVEPQVCVSQLEQVGATETGTDLCGSAANERHFRDDVWGTCQESVVGARGAEQSRIKSQSVFAGIFSFACGASCRNSALLAGESAGESPVCHSSRFYINKFRNLRI